MKAGYNSNKVHTVYLYVRMSVITQTVNDLFFKLRKEQDMTDLYSRSHRSLFLDFALSSYSFHGLLDCLLISQELHGS